MATTGTQGLRRQSISSKRAQQSIKTIEAYFGTAIGGYTSNNTSSQETLSRQELERNIKRSVGQTNKR
jgi:hypothetical protein